MSSENNYLFAQKNRLNFECTDNVLFLQGPVGSIFSRFSKSIEKKVNSITHVNFCTGDKLFNFTKVSIDYKDHISNWPEYLSDIISEKKITKVYLMNDCRPYHLLAIKLLKKLNIMFWVFEDGYFRPNLLTLEAFGVNGNSFFQHSKEIPDLVNKDHLEIKNPILNMTTERVIYSILSLLDIFLFSEYKPYRRIDPLSKFKEIIFSNLIRIKKKFRTNLFKLNKKNIILALLQVDDDTQIKFHSLFDSNLEFIQLLTEVIASKNSSYHIIFKAHPLDLISAYKYEKILNEKDFRNFDFCFDDDLDFYLDNADKVICINSTAGIKALLKNKKVFCCGNSVYSKIRLNDINEIRSYLSEFIDGKYSIENFHCLEDLKKVTQLNATFYK